MMQHASELSIAPQSFIDCLLQGARQAATHTAPDSLPRRLEPTQRTLGLLGACLVRFDPDVTYAVWYRVGAAVFNETAGDETGFALFDRWSSAGRKYKGSQDTGKVWRSFRPDHPRPVTLASLRFMVEASGHSWAEVLAEAEPFDAVDEGGA